MSSRHGNELVTAETKIQHTESVVWRRVEDSIILVHLGTSKTYELNRTGGRLWELLIEGSTYADALAALGSEFEVSEKQLQSEARKLIRLLFDERLAEERTPAD